MTRTWLIAAVALVWTLPAAAQESAVRRAPEVYDKWCTPCHGSGEGKPGTAVRARISHRDPGW